MVGTCSKNFIIIFNVKFRYLMSFIKWPTCHRYVFIISNKHVIWPSFWYNIILHCSRKKVYKILAWLPIRVFTIYFKKCCFSRVGILHTHAVCEWINYKTFTNISYIVWLGKKLQSQEDFLLFLHTCAAIFSSTRE